MKILLTAITLLSLAIIARADEAPAPKNVSEMTCPKEIHARFLPGNELWKRGVVRIYTDNRSFTVTYPLNVKLWVFDKSGAILRIIPLDHGFGVSWGTEAPEPMVIERKNITEIPIEAYNNPTTGQLATNLGYYDTKLIGSVWITFSGHFDRQKEEQVAVQIPMSVVLHPPHED